MPVAAPHSAPTILRFISLTVLVTLLAGSCSGDGPTGPGDPPVVASVVVTPGTDTIMTVGRTRQYTAQPREADGTPISGLTVAWSSSNPAAATVDPATGLVTAVGGGTAIITATVNSIIGTGTFAVVQFVAGVTITPGAAAAAVIGETEAFTAVAKDSSGATVPGVKFLWVSGDPDVATVDTLGVATATGPGEVTISATGRGTPGYAEFTVTQVATQLHFSVAPTSAVAGSAISPAIQVEIRDAGGTLVADARDAVTVSLATNPATATLGGTRTVNAVGGIATISGLWIDKAAAGYTLEAKVGDLNAVVSTPFEITAGPAIRVEFGTSVPFTLVAAAPFEQTLDVRFLDAYGNPAATSTTTLSLFSDGRPDFRNLLSSNAPSVTAPGVVSFAGIRIDRPGSSFQIEARAGALAARTNDIVVNAYFSTIALGAEHACGNTTLGALCWGRNNAGQLGSEYPVSYLPHDSLPDLIYQSPVFSAIDAGGIGTCGIALSTQVYCWGDGEYLPFSIAGTGPGGLVFTGITRGQDHACGWTSTGAAYCWGTGTSGQLGDGNGTSSATPVQVAGSGAGGMIFSSLSAGGRFTCGVTTATTAYCWGSNIYGNLGDSTFVSTLGPVLVAGSGGGVGVSDRQFVAIAAGDRHTCARTAQRAFCWGANGVRQLGIGTAESNRVVPTMVNIGLASLPTWAVGEISVGDEHSCALVSPTNRVFCWGSNTSGQLGAGLIGASSEPVLVSLIASPQRVRAGGGVTCSELSGERWWCWGANQRGQLGIGTMLIPVAYFATKVVQ